MRQILFLCLFSTTFLTSYSEAKLISTNPGMDSIYGRDDRELINEKSPIQIKMLASSIAMIVSADAVDSYFFRTFIKAQMMKDTLNMCADENFVTKPSLPNCTGFLVAPDILATAGHCFEDESDCSSKKIIFEVNSRNQNKNGYAVLSRNVYSCKEIIRSQDAFDYDYALIRLDRSTSRKPLKLNQSSAKISDDASVFMLGHPFGLPLMLSQAAPVSDNSDVVLFKTGLDSFEGNSGSPVFNVKTLEVEGILVNGQEDLVLDSSRECYRNKSYDGAGAEGVTRIIHVLPFIK